MKTVTFFGHSKLSPAQTPAIKEKLESELEALIKQGADIFLLGGYGDFDNLCARAVRSLKEKHPHITSVLVIPYMTNPFDKNLYDCSEYPPLENVPQRFAILKRNEYMAERADAVVSYIDHEWGGAYKAVEYARKKGKQIIMI